MSIAKLTVRFLFLLGVLGALPACNPVPIVLMNFSNMPKESWRMNIVVYQGSNIGQVTFQREDKTNKWLPMDTMTKPPAEDCPPLQTMALELPRGADGAMTLKVLIDPVVMGMMGQPLPPTMPVAGACVKFEMHDGALNEVAVPLLNPPPPCP